MPKTGLSRWIREEGNHSPTHSLRVTVKYDGTLHTHTPCLQALVVPRASTTLEAVARIVVTTLQQKSSPAPSFGNDQVEDEINVPIALSAFRDKEMIITTAAYYIV